MTIKASKIELEFMLSWIAQNGQLFQQYYNEIFDKYPAPEYKHTARARKGYLVIVARYVPQQTLKGN